MMGTSSGGFLVGSDFLLSELDRIQAGASALLADDGVDALPGSAFVFCAHQGYQFLYFIVGDSPDPKVLYYLESETVPREVARHFSEWLANAVSQECQHAMGTRER